MAARWVDQIYHEKEAGACRGQMMPGANACWYAPLPNSSIVECEKYKHSKTICPDICHVHKNYATKTSPQV